MHTENFHHKKQKAFNVVPAEDDLTQQIVSARKMVLRDKDLCDGAKVLFCFLIDLAVSKSTMHGFGAVVISTTKIGEHLNRCARAIYKWKKQLVARRHVWISKYPVPNFWPMDIFHISELNAPGELNQMATRDGLWGNGERRSAPEHQGMGARGVRRTKCHRSSDRVTPHDPSILPDNATGSRTEGHLSAAQYAADSRTTCGGEPQVIRRGAVKNAADSRTKEHLPAARNVTSPPHKQAHLIKAQEVDKHTEIEKEGVKAAPPTDLDVSFNKWVDSLQGRFGSHLEKMRERFTEQLKKATPDGKALLKRKLDHLDVLLDGPQPEWEKPKPRPTRAMPTEPEKTKAMSEEELLVSARTHVEMGLKSPLNEAQRQALSKAGEL